MHKSDYDDLRSVSQLSSSCSRASSTGIEACSRGSSILPAGGGSGAATFSALHDMEQLLADEVDMCRAERVQMSKETASSRSQKHIASTTPTTTTTTFANSTALQHQLASRDRHIEDLSRQNKMLTEQLTALMSMSPTSSLSGIIKNTEQKRSNEHNDDADTAKLQVTQLIGDLKCAEAKLQTYAMKLAKQEEMNRNSSVSLMQWKWRGTYAQTMLAKTREELVNEKDVHAACREQLESITCKFKAAETELTRSKEEVRKLRTQKQKQIPNSSENDVVITTMNKKTTFPTSIRSVPLSVSDAETAFYLLDVGVVGVVPLRRAMRALVTLGLLVSETDEQQARSFFESIYASDSFGIDREEFTSIVMYCQRKPENDDDWSKSLVVKPKPKSDQKQYQQYRTTTLSTKELTSAFLLFDWRPVASGIETAKLSDILDFLGIPCMDDVRLVEITLDIDCELSGVLTFGQFKKIVQKLEIEAGLLNV